MFRSVPPSEAAGRQPSRRGHVAKRWLYLIHRWIGIASCVLFAMWFASGLVMIYVPYPSLSLSERLAGQEAIDWTRVDVPPPIGDGGTPQSLELDMRDGQPVWRMQDWDGGRHSVPARRGVVEAAVDEAFARRVAGRFGKAQVSVVDRIARDQWTVADSFDCHRPLWRASLADGAGTQLYVSASTGGIVQSTTRSERFWNWLGSVPHWLYPTILRQDQSAWRQVVLWVSGPCIAAAVTGIWIGLLRTRIGARRFRGGRMTPYHGWMFWHHVAGLVGGVMLVLWIFSGWLSVDPGYVFTSPDPPQASGQHYASATDLPPINLARLGSVARGTRLARFTAAAGLPRVTLLDAHGGRRILTLPDLAQAAPAVPAIEQAAAILVPKGKLVRSALLTAPDAYWYDVGARPQLPVLRLRFDDPARTWLHIDPRTGEILQRVDARRRTYRWLYDMFHKWDLNALTLHRPLWDILLWLFSLAGLVTSISGIWIGWKRLRR
jgi:hypothetical protein